MKLDDLQLKIMTVLWQKGEASVVDVRKALSDERELAITTVGTVLSRLEKKKIVTHSKEGRQFVYRPLISELNAKSSMISNLAERLFRGDTRSMVNHLISEDEFNEADLADIEKMIEDYKKKRSQK